MSLYDNSATPLHLDPGERHDFMVKHDIKEISAYTLVCSSSYSTADGVAYQPQYFKFNAANPLSGDLFSARSGGTLVQCHRPVGSYVSEAIMLPIMRSLLNMASAGHAQDCLNHHLAHEGLFCGMCVVVG